MRLNVYRILADYSPGAKYVLLLGSDLSQAALEGRESEAEEGVVKQGAQIKVGAIAHGTLVTKDDMAGMTKPLTVVAVKDDPLFPEEVLEDGRKAMAEKQQVIEVETYPAVPHGFAVLGDYSDEKIVEAQKRAFQQMVDFLKAH